MYICECCVDHKHTAARTTEEERACLHVEIFVECLSSKQTSARSARRFLRMAFLYNSYDNGRVVYVMMCSANMTDSLLAHSLQLSILADE